MPREELPKVEDDMVVDYLEEDPEIPTQRYVAISFLSPEKVLKQKSEFYNEKFIEWLEYDWKIKGMEKFMAFLSKTYDLKIDDLFKHMEDFRKVHNEDIRKTDVNEQYKVFLLKEEKDLEAQFTEKVGFQTNVRGVKVRRSFANVEECQTYASVLQRRYPNDSIAVGKVGAWLPWDPSEHLMPEVQYAEKELNELMRKYKENELNREMFFEEEKTKKIEAQKQDNKKRIEEERKKEKSLMDLPAVHPSEGAIRE
jgi:hypothetical protein